MNMNHSAIWERIVRLKKGAALLVTVMLLLMLSLTGCQKAYAPIEVPTLEQAEGGVVPEDMQESQGEDGKTSEPSADSADAQAKAESSIRETVITSETAPAYQTVEETVYVTGSQVNLRRTAGPSGEIAAKLSKGTSLKRTGVSDSWSRVIYENQECYISSQYVSVSPPETEPETKALPAGSGGKGKLIAIDPGHQAKGNNEKEPDGPGSSVMKAKVASGTQGNVTGLPEYKLTLAVSMKLKQELLDRGYQVYMVRETHDVNISNAERAELANNSGADIFVRVHANSLNDTSVHGALTMCQTKKNPYNGNLYTKSQALSRTVVDGIASQTGFKNKGIQETDTMSGINWCKIPVTIVEMGFMSNAEEDKKMATEEYQNKIAKGIADGIDAYYGAGN